MVGFKHQPRNPFRTAQRNAYEEWWLPGWHTMNPTWKIILQICYVAAVGALLVTVSLLAISAIYQMPSPHETGGVGLHHHHPAVEYGHDIQQKVIPRKGGRVRGQSRLPPVFDTNENQKPPAQHYHSVSGARGSFHHDDEEDEPVIQEEELVMLQRANPAGNDLKILGETKEQVKQEISQEEHSEHAFGAQLGDENEAELSKGSDVREITARNATKTDELEKDKKSSHSVQVIRRRGESELSKGSDNKENTDRNEEEAAERDQVLKSSHSVQVIRRRGDSRPEDTKDVRPGTSTAGEAVDAADSADGDDEQSAHKRLRPIRVASEIEASPHREDHKRSAEDSSNTESDLLHEKAERKRPIEIPTGSKALKTHLRAPPIAIAIEE